MTDVQERIQRHLDDLVGRDVETGLQVAVYQRGALLVDAVAGEADATLGRPLTSETPIFSFSTGKNVSATLAHVLVDRGYLDYDTRVADLWPEFGTHGKASATLRHVLTHTVGVPAMPRGVTPSDLPDWSRVCEALAAAEPLWPPGSAMGYHSYTFGFLVGELARRATGSPIGVLLHDWITEPLGLEGQLWFGVPGDRLPVLAHLEQPDPPDAAPPAERSVLAPWERQPSATLGNRAELLRADIPSVATATARGLAAVFDAVLRGELVDEASVARLAAPAYEGEDLVFGVPVRMALGFPIGRIGAPPEERSAAFGWSGGGGSYAYADPANGIAFALTKTRITPDLDAASSVAGIVIEELDRRS